MRLAVLFASLLLPAAAFAGGAVTSVIAVPSPSEHGSAIALVQTADYVCITLAVSNRDKDPDRQAEQVRSAIRTVQSAVAKSPSLQLHEGPVRFHTAPRFSVSFGASRKGSYSFSDFGPGALRSQIRLLYKLNGSGNDPLAAAVTVRKFIEGLKLDPNTDLQVVDFTLAVESPERQRERLLQLIRESAGAMKRTFGAEKITIGGLNGPVLVRQVDESSVELYIDYQLSVTTDD
jgi:hypothetical protein